jgi:hypothetical protein
MVWEVMKTKIASWKGNGIKTTEPFTVTKAPWKIAWTQKVSQYGGVLSILIYKTNGNMESIAANSSKSGSDVSYVYNTGTFYLEINSFNSDYTIEVYGKNDNERSMVYRKCDFSFLFWYTGLLCLKPSKVYITAAK